MKKGGIEELTFYNGQFFDKTGNNVTDLVSFTWVYPRNRFSI